MFSRIFVEKDIQNWPRLQELLQRLPMSGKASREIFWIDDVHDIFNRVKKPYLSKREDWQLFIGKKRSSSVKEAPNAYGTKSGKHYYFVSAYNCLYECNYCYLQGHFHSPDLVWFINYEDILKEMENVLSMHPQEKVWFHAGEFSDSLALAHLTQEWPYFFAWAQKYPQAILELRTKSANISSLKNLTPLSNVIITFSLAPSDVAKKNDLKTPFLSHRLKALAQLQKLGHPIGLHFDPIIYRDSFKESYEELFDQLQECIDLKTIEYLSLGVVRFTKDVFKEVKKNYPEAEFLNSEMIKSSDNKMRYPRPMRLWMLGQIKNLAIGHGIDRDKIYFCMED